jgi:hypothetical protein
MFATRGQGLVTDGVEHLAASSASESKAVERPTGYHAAHASHVTRPHRALALAEATRADDGDLAGVII